MKKRLLSVVMALAMICSFASWVPDLEAFAASNPYPIDGINGSTGAWSNCTWSVWKLVKDNLGIELPSWGWAGAWLENAHNSGYQTGTTPSKNSIVVYQNGGHVAFVTDVSSDGSQIYVKEGGYGSGSNLGYHEGWTTSSGIRYGSQYVYGYIYLGSSGDKPAWAKVSVPKSTFAVGEEITFTLTSDIGKAYTVGIDDSNGNRIHTYSSPISTVSTTQYYKYTINTPGNYSCYITTFNDVGLCDSERIYFSVATKPAWAKVSVPKSSYVIGEEIVFTLTSDTGKSYTIGIDNSNGDRIYTYNFYFGSGSTTQYCKYAISEPGDYSCYITAINDIGLCDSERIDFSIAQPVDLGDNFYAIISNSYLKRVLSYSPNISDLIFEEPNNESNQTWYFIKQDNGSYMIKILDNNAYIDVAYSGTTPGTNVGVCAPWDHDNPAQKWSFYGEQGTYKLIPQCASLVLSSMITELGIYNAQLENDTGNSNQLFEVKKVCDAKEGIHTYSKWTTKQKASCLEDGLEESTCDYCGKVETRTIDKTGHSWGETTYTWSTDNKTCTATRSCAYDISHKETETVNTSYAVTKEPTETSEGTGKYTAKFTNTAFATKTKTVTIPALSHTHEWGNPTYSWSSDYKTCTATRVCTKDSSHKETETVYSTSVIKTAATCTAKGTKTYSATFENPAFAKQTKNVKNIPAIGHDWNQPVYEWSVDKKTCTATRTCANDNSHKETETVNSTYAVTKEPTENADGVGTYTAKFTNTAFETKTKSVTIPALSHTHEWGDPTYSWSSDYKTCTATRFCTKDSSHKEIETVNTSYTVTTEPTETVDGVGKFTARFTSNVFSTQTKTVSVPALSHTHSWGEPTYTWSSNHKTCTATRVCTLNSSHTETETVNSSSIVKTPATCTVKGTTTYTAIFTNKAFANQTKDVQDIEVKEHTWSEWKTTAFDASKGTSTQTRTCSVCHKTETKTVDNAIQRLAGSGRYATAADISKAGFPNGAKTVVLAYGLNYADALAGVSLATAMNAPILLTNLKTLPKETIAEIKRLGATDVIILGGEGAISAEVENELESLGLYTERIAGKTRFETATKIARKIQKINNKAPEEVFFVYAFNSADALSVSAVAAVKGAPVIYLNTNGDIDDATAAYLKSIKGSVKNAYVVGGSGVISDEMMMSAGDMLGVIPTRVFGKNRFETCIAVNNTFKDTLDGESVCVATGMDFPDALAGGVFAAINRAPLFIVNGKEQTLNLSATQKSYLKTKSPQKIYVFGGTGAVSDSHVKTVATSCV